MQVKTYMKARSGVIVDGPARSGKSRNKTLVNGNRQEPGRSAMLRHRHLGAFVAVVLLILFCRRGDAESCSPTMLNDVGWGQKILNVYPGIDGIEGSTMGLCPWRGRISPGRKLSRGQEKPQRPGAAVVPGDRPLAAHVEPWTRGCVGPPRASAQGWVCDTPGAVRRRTRRRLPGGHAPEQWGAAANFRCWRIFRITSPCVMAR